MTSHPNPARSMLLDLKAFTGAAEALEATAPVACARHGGAAAIIADGRLVVSGGGFWSFTPDEDTWQELAAEGQARFRSNTGDAIDPTLHIGRTRK